MRVLLRTVVFVGFLLSTGCAGPSLHGGRDQALPAITALQEGRFERAEKLARDDRNAYDRLVRAVVRYKKSTHQLALDARTLVAGVAVGGVNQKYLTATFETAEAELAGVEEDLACAAKDPNLAVEVCLACWEIRLERRRPKL